MQGKKNLKQKKKKKIIKGLKCTLCLGGVQEVTYKDIYRLKKFVSRRGKIVPRARTGNCAKHQRNITSAIKRARYMALMPYSVTD